MTNGRGGMRAGKPGEIMIWAIDERAADRAGIDGDDDRRFLAVRSSAAMVRRVGRLGARVDVGAPMRGAPVHPDADKVWLHLRSLFDVHTLAKLSRIARYLGRQGPGAVGDLGREDREAWARAEEALSKLWKDWPGVFETWEPQPIGPARKGLDRGRRP